MQVFPTVTPGIAAGSDGLKSASGVKKSACADSDGLKSASGVKKSACADSRLADTQSLRLLNARRRT